VDQENICDVTDGDRLVRCAAAKRLRMPPILKTAKIGLTWPFCFERRKGGSGHCLYFDIQSNANLRV